MNKQKEVVEKKEFEKLFMNFGDKRYLLADIAIANCPDDWTKCSFVLSTHRNDHHGFVHVFIDQPELDRIIEALQKVKEDMAHET